MIVLSVAVGWFALMGDWGVDPGAGFSGSCCVIVVSFLGGARDSDTSESPQPHLSPMRAGGFERVGIFGVRGCIHFVEVFSPQFSSFFFSSFRLAWLFVYKYMYAFLFLFFFSFFPWGLSHEGVVNCTVWCNWLVLEVYGFSGFVEGFVWVSCWNGLANSSVSILRTELASD